MTSDWNAYQQSFTVALRQGDERAARRVVTQAQESGIDGGEIYLRIFAPSMVAIGDLWERNELNIAEEHLATAITERLIGQLAPVFESAQAIARGVVLLGCVAGERHVLGLRMLADLFRREGWRVLFLGADVASDDWVQMATRFQADIVALSISTARLAPVITDVIARLHEALPKTSVLVGGAAFNGNSELWRIVGADVYDSDPQLAVQRSNQLMLHRGIAYS